MDSAASSSPHVNSLAASLALVVHVVSIVLLIAVPADAIDIVPGKRIAGFGEVEDAVDEQQDHVDESEHEPVPLLGHLLQFLHT